MGRVAGRFARVEPRRRVRAFVAGLLAELPRKNCWTIAEHAGEANPDGMQHLLARAVWDADAVRDDVRGYVVEQLADPDAVLVVDETGDLKKGLATVGVQRQYTGTAGRTENAQVTVWLTYATAAGHGLIDRALYLPRCWTDDPDRRAAAGVPAGVGFATKPTLARQMIARTLDAGVPARWVAADEVYGADPGLRADLRAPPGRLRPGGGPRLPGADRRRPDPRRHAHPAAPTTGLAAALGRRRRQGPPRLRLGPDRHSRRPGRAGQWWLLVRRHRRTGKRAYYRCYSPAPVPLTTLVRVAGSQMDGRGGLPDRQRTDRAGPAPGPPLDLLAPLGHPHPARPRLPHRHRRGRTRPSTGTQPARFRSPATRSATSSPPPAPTAPDPGPPAALVDLATTPPTPRPRQPLPATSHPRTMKITNYGWSTKFRHLGAQGPPRSLAWESAPAPPRRRRVPA